MLFINALVRVASFGELVKWIAKRGLPKRISDPAEEIRVDDEEALRVCLQGLSSDGTLHGRHHRSRIVVEVDVLNRLNVIRASHSSVVEASRGTSA